MATNSIQERFWSKVTKASGANCWLWSGRRTSLGYGAFDVGRGIKPAHRFAWELTHGPIKRGPKRMCVCHHCDTPHCVRPDHLFLGTHSDNMRDKAMKGRAPGRDQRGSINASAKLTDANVYAIRADRRPQAEIARDYKVTQSMISKIHTRSSWSHLT